jgi:PAS domain S-box-containing protein
MRDDNSLPIKDVEICSDPYQSQPIGCYEVSIMGDRFISVDESLCALLGYSRNEIYSMNPLDLLDQDSKDAFIEIVMRKELSGEVTEKAVFKVKTSAGHFIVFGAELVNIKYKGTEQESAVVKAYSI